MTSALQVLLVSVVLVLYVSCDTQDFSKAVFEKRMPRPTGCSGDKDCISEAEKLVNGFGYPFEEHFIESEDGYIISLHRIPFSKKVRSLKTERPVALFQHGLLAASDTWLFRGPNKDLAYLLADAGYDIWIINARGNVYSRRHKILDPDKDRDYWKFSFHEMGIYDLPASIDYVLNLTNQKNVYLIGHSMGASTALILLSMKPEYNEKIRLIAGLAPCAYVVHKLSPFLKFSTSVLPPLMNRLKKSNYTEIFPRRELTREMLTFLCRDKSSTQKICVSLLFMFVGVQNDQLDTSLFPSIAKYYPSGTSLDTFAHMYQMFTSGFYRAMDYGKLENMQRYKREIPADYNVTKITAPVSLHYGDGDFLVTKDDSEYLASKLPNVVGIFKVSYPYFNHMDFMWSTDSKKLIYDPLIKLMNKFR